MMNSVISSTTLPLLTSDNWYQWEQLALNSISVYGHAGRAIQTNVPCVPKPPSKPLRIHYIEEVILDPITNNVTEQGLGMTPLTVHFITRPPKPICFFKKDIFVINNLYGHI